MAGSHAQEALEPWRASLGVFGLERVPGLGFRGLGFRVSPILAIDPYDGGVLGFGTRMECRRPTFRSTCLREDSGARVPNSPEFWTRSEDPLLPAFSSRVVPETLKPLTLNPIALKKNPKA